MAKLGDSPRVIKKRILVSVRLQSHDLESGFVTVQPKEVEKNFNLVNSCKNDDDAASVDELIRKINEFVLDQTAKFSTVID